MEYGQNNSLNGETLIPKITQKKKKIKNKCKQMFLCSTEFLKLFFFLWILILFCYVWHHTPHKIHARTIFNKQKFKFVQHEDVIQFAVFFLLPF